VTDLGGRDPRRTSWLGVAVRTVAGIVTAAAGGLWLFLAFAVVHSRFSTDPANDPHGFGLIFGTMFAVVTGLVFAVALPFAFPPERRARVSRITMATYVITSALLFAAWFSA
jgi:hypothetical protein